MQKYMMIHISKFYFYFLRLCLFIFRARGREGEREGEKHQCVVTSCLPPSAELAHNLSMCPDWESNQQPLGSQASAQSSEPHQPGLKTLNKNTMSITYFSSVPNTCEDDAVTGAS